MAWMLVVKEPGQATKEYMLNGKEIRIGRSKKCQIRLTDPMASGFHARLIPISGEYYIQDLGSTNGTFLNSKRVQRDPIGAGDELELANCKLTLLEMAAKNVSAKTQIYSGAAVEDALARRSKNSDQIGKTQQDKHRTGEGGPVPFRSSRYFSINGEWFFSTREGANHGPYTTLDRAKAALLNYGSKLGFMSGFDNELYGL